jgi:hypothetical protein
VSDAQLPIGATSLVEQESAWERVRAEVVGGLRAVDDTPLHDDSGFTKGRVAAVAVAHTRW